MARGRMLNKKISNSKRVNNLPLGAQLLYTWLIAHLDVNGCFYGNARMINNLVFPRKNIKENVIENFLKSMEREIDGQGTPLIFRYYVNNEQYLFMPGFEGEQVGLRRDKEKPEFPTFDGKITESFRQNVVVREVEVEVEVEEKEESNKEEKTAVLKNTDKNSKDSKVATETEFLEAVEEISKEFPDLDCEVEFRKFNLWWSENGKKLRRPKTAWYNWLVKARQIASERRGDGTNRQYPEKYALADRAQYLKDSISKTG